MLYYILAVVLYKTVTCKVLLESPLDTYANQISLANAFPGCLIYVINSFGHNLNLTQLLQPTILLRYIPHNIYSYIYAIEDVHKWTSGENVSLWGTEEGSSKYLNLLFQESVKLAYKNTNCEANIYFHPKNAKQSPYFYAQRSELNWDLVFRDPFWLHKHLNLTKENWRQDYMNTVPKYSLLVCSNSYTSACHNYKTRYQWISTALMFPEFLRLSEYIFIWEYTSMGEYLHVFCPYCNPCYPFETLKFTGTSQTFPILMRNAIKDIVTVTPEIIEASLYFRMDPYEHLKNNGQRSKRTLLDYLRRISKNDVFFTYAIDIHVLSLLVPKNVTMQFLPNFIESYGKWKVVPLDSCPDGNQDEWRHGTLRPLIHSSVSQEISSEQQIGLILHRTQLRFVSCHKKQSPWLHQLKELVTAFDIFTWLLLIFSCGVVAHVASFNKKKSYSFWNVYFSLVGSVMDQSSNLFSQPGNNKLLLFWLPLIFLVLSYEYKGDNITNLTLEPKLVPFDTFKKLILNNFTIFTRNIYTSLYDKLKPNLEGKEFARISRHEAYPLVSELWFQILAKFKAPPNKVFSKLKSQVPQKLLTYLDHSESFPKWKQENGIIRSEETVERMMSIHMEACNKAATILDDNLALALYTSLKFLNKPAYFGKDVITENLRGYKYSGYLPTSFKLKPRYFFQTGIAEWWQKYLKWYLVVRIQTEKTRNISGVDDVGSNNEQASTGTYVLSFIPMIGFCLSMIGFWLSIISFVCFDGRTCGSICSCLTHLAWGIKNYKIVKVFRQNINLDVQSQIGTISCSFCQIQNRRITFEKNQELELHMAHAHTEHYFLDGLITEQKLDHFHRICNLVLNSELETVDSKSNEREEDHNNFKCPFDCEFVESENLHTLKLHFIAVHRKILLERLKRLMVLDDPTNEIRD